MAQSDGFKAATGEEHLDQPAPFYERVKSMIKTKIHSGAWPVNYRVPSESELVNQLGYSRMTGEESPTGSLPSWRCVFLRRRKPQASA